MRSECGVLVANKPDGVVLRGLRGHDGVDVLRVMGHRNLVLRSSRGHHVPDLEIVYRRVFGLGGSRVVDCRYNLWLQLRLSLSTLADDYERHDKDHRPHQRAANDEPEITAVFPAVFVAGLGREFGRQIGRHIRGRSGRNFGRLGCAQRGRWGRDRCRGDWRRGEVGGGIRSGGGDRR